MVEVIEAISSIFFDIAFLALFIIGWSTAILAVQKYTQLEEELAKAKAEKGVVVNIDKDTTAEQVIDAVGNILKARDELKATYEQAVNADDENNNRDN